MSPSRTFRKSVQRRGLAFFTIRLTSSTIHCCPPSGTSPVAWWGFGYFSRDSRRQAKFLQGSVATEAINPGPPGMTHNDAGTAVPVPQAAARVVSTCGIGLDGARLFFLGWSCPGLSTPAVTTSIDSR